jgi:hypothetical protein
MSARCWARKARRQDSTPGLDASVETSRLALALFGSWDFFRVKLDQRRNESYRQPLRMADELAWLCYRPVRDRGRKEPPLVFFNGGTSPFILRRDVGFHADSVPKELVATDSIVEATARLPFPVIGIPWTQMNHLPDAVVIGHEVGHAVEADLKLQTDVDRAIDAALAGSDTGKDRSVYWRKWRSELFADLYGCLVAGPAFTRGLRDFLAAPKSSVVADHPSLTSDYPPVSVRIRFNDAVLEAMGFTGGDSLWSGWTASYGAPPATLDPYITDAVDVAKQMYAAPLDALSKQPITSLLTFRPEDFADAGDLAKAAAEKKKLVNLSDLRVLFAATRVAYDVDPKGYNVASGPKGRSTLDRIKELIVLNVADVYRAGEKPYPNTHDEAHRARGSDWLNAIRAMPWNERP